MEDKTAPSLEMQVILLGDRLRRVHYILRKAMTETQTESEQIQMLVEADEIVTEVQRALLG